MPMPIPMPMPVLVLVLMLVLVLTRMHIRIFLTDSSPYFHSKFPSQRVSGNGLALVGCSIEQDAAYWEWQIERIGAGGGSVDDDENEKANAPKFGVATKKDQKFYRALQGAEIDGEFGCCWLGVCELLVTFANIITCYFDLPPQRQ
jgi:hypothetical protein